MGHGQHQGSRGLGRDHRHRRVFVAIIDTGVDVITPTSATTSGPTRTRSPATASTTTTTATSTTCTAGTSSTRQRSLDDNGHGTHVAGTIGAVGNNGVGVAGVNWRVKLVALKFLDDSGVGYESDAVGALQYARDQGIRISNNSWGGFGFSQALYDAIASLRADGHLFVTAAGNSSFDNDLLPFYPASFDLENVISVASITSADHCPTSRTTARRVSTSAHRARVSTARSRRIRDVQRHFDGHSARHRCGGFAPQRASRWTYGQLRTTILDSARPIAALSGITVTGGTLDLYAAVTASTCFPPLISRQARSTSAGRWWAGPRRRMVTLTNTGPLVLPITSITANSTAFVVSHTCGSSVVVGASCTISVVLKPTTAGAKSGTLTVRAAMERAPRRSRCRARPFRCLRSHRARSVRRAGGGRDLGGAGGDADEHRDAGAADLVDHRQQHCVRRESHLWQLGGGWVRVARSAWCSSRPPPERRAGR